jgi:hypothetical protein
MPNIPLIITSLSFFAIPFISFAATFTEEDEKASSINVPSFYIYEGRDSNLAPQRTRKRRRLNDDRQTVSEASYPLLKKPALSLNKRKIISADWIDNPQFTPETRASAVLSIACQKLREGYTDEAAGYFLKLIKNEDFPLNYREKAALQLATLGVNATPIETSIIFEYLLDSQDIYTKNAAKLSLGHIYKNIDAIIEAADLYRELAKDKEAPLILRASAARNYYRMAQKHNDNSVLPLDEAVEILNNMLLIPGIDNKDKFLITKILDDEIVN